MLVYLKILLLIPSILAAAGLLTVGAMILLRKRPLLLKGSLLAWVVSLATGLVVLSLAAFLIAAAEPSMTCLGVVQILILMFLVYSIRRSVRGYFLMGITEGVFRQALHAAFNEQNLPFEETITGFILPSLSGRLRASIAPRLGTAQISLEGEANPGVLDEVARRADSFLGRTYGSFSEAAVLIYGVLGLAILALAAYQWGRF